MEGGRRPLELILARNLLASLSTPAFLVDGDGVVAFYNDAAGAMLGRRYEDEGPMPAKEWMARYGPFGDDGTPLPFERLGLTEILRGDRAGHGRFTIQAHDGTPRAIEASGLPIVGTEGYRGAIVVFWPVDT